MIDVVTQRNIKQFFPTPSGETLIYAQHQLRYKALLPLGWEAPSFDHEDQIEFDDFDTPKTIYLIKRDKPGNVQGVVRINPTNHRYMLLKQEFSAMVAASQELPRQPDVWEGSRIAFNPDIDKADRRRSIAEMSLAKAELIKGMNIKSLVGMMPKRFWDSVFAGTGWDIKPLGQEVSFKDSEPSIACIYSITDEAIQTLRTQLGVRNSILNLADTAPSTQPHSIPSTIKTLG